MLLCAMVWSPLSANLKVGIRWCHLWLSDRLVFLPWYKCSNVPVNFKIEPNQLLALWHCLNPIWGGKVVFFAGCNSMAVFSIAFLLARNLQSTLPRSRHASPCINSTVLHYYMMTTLISLFPGCSHLHVLITCMQLLQAIKDWRCMGMAQDL